LTDASVANDWIRPYLNHSDFFTISTDRCPEGYTYFNFSESLNKTDGGKYCFIIDEWTSEDAVKRYKNEKIGWIQSEIENLFNGYNTFLYSYEIIINDTLNQNKIFFKNFNDTQNLYINILKDRIIKVLIII
jgi:hypothetical protein